MKYKLNRIIAQMKNIIKEPETYSVELLKGARLTILRIQEDFLFDKVVKKDIKPFEKLAPLVLEICDKQIAK